MQINGIREFLSRFSFKFSPLTGTEGGQKNSMASVPLTRKDASDTLALSGAGARLRFNSRPDGITQLTGANVNASDPITSLMEKHLSKMEETLEKMHALAAAAANDKKLPELDRMNMQIEMEDLRAELSGASRSMNTELAKRAGYTGPGVADAAESDPSAIGDSTSSVLKRARARLDKGEAWDVREGSRQLLKVKEVRYKDGVMTPDEEGKIAVDLPEDAKWFAVPDETAEAETEYYAMSRGETDYAGTKTVRQKLEASGTIILMDSQSAEKGVKRLEAEMEKFTAMKDEFMAFKADPQRNRAMNKAEAVSLAAAYAAMQNKLLAKKEEDSEEGSKGDETKLFLTEIGIMKTDESGANPQLVYAANPKGQMFAKLGRFFESMAGNLSTNFINEEVKVTGVGYVNLTGTFPEAA